MRLYKIISVFPFIPFLLCFLYKYFLLLLLPHDSLHPSSHRFPFSPSHSTLFISSKWSKEYALFLKAQEQETGEWVVICEKEKKIETGKGEVWFCHPDDAPTPNSIFLSVYHCLSVSLPLSLCGGPSQLVAPPPHTHTAPPPAAPRGTGRARSSAEQVFFCGVLTSTACCHFRFKWLSQIEHTHTHTHIYTHIFFFLSSPCELA